VDNKFTKLSDKINALGDYVLMYLDEFCLFT